MSDFALVQMCETAPKPVWSKNSCGFAVSQKIKYFNADELMEGTTQPGDLTLERFRQAIPLEWPMQRRRFGFPPH
jgi:hypothetical protein